MYITKIKALFIDFDDTEKKGNIVCVMITVLAADSLP